LNGSKPSASAPGSIQARCAIAGCDGICLIWSGKPEVGEKLTPDAGRVKRDS
jgi:hypothetical protein